MKNTLTYILLLCSFFGSSQELHLPVFTQYLADNNFVLSPTFAGIGDNLRIRANGLTQWVGIKDAPQNQSLYADFRLANRSGIGLSLYNDSNGNTFQTGAKFSFAHHIILDYYSKQYLSFGLSYNINSFKIDISKFNTTYEIPILDPSITNNRAISNNNFDVGLLYRNKGFYMSFNASNILPKTKDNYLGIEPSLVLNYQLYSGYVIKNSYNRNVEIEPSVYYQYFAGDQRSTTDINLKYRRYNSYDDYYWAGISYRGVNDQVFKPLNIGPMAGFKKSNFYFGYSYQITLNQLAAYNSGTHVVTLGFDFLQGISDCPCTQSPVHD
ncbi:type IX secretion system membrane protein PorP/SprF [Flavobacterium sp.]|uniref:PorP/SprF family type IX secretion system membrane protein n=1 Tax=Flavobacterium sp. TaxID=239 RepID=UPI00286EFC95|nr:type IX secretion system membrane protein PorP/SprF [Flavobacterium sp.]